MRKQQQREKKCNTQERETAQERKRAAFALFIADIYWLGNLKAKGCVCVCSVSAKKLDIEKYLCYS